MKEIFSEIEIQAPAGRVWQVLTDFTATGVESFHVPNQRPTESGNAAKGIY